MCQPLLLISLRNSTLYDGLRHILFTVPLIFILATTFWYELGKLVGFSIIGVLAAVHAVLFTWDNVAMFPYNYVSFNLPSRQIVDARNFETDFWGFSLKEAAQKPVVSQSKVPVLGNPAHLVGPYVPAGTPLVLELSEMGRLPAGSKAVLVSYTRGMAAIPQECSEPQYVKRQLPIGGRILYLSFAARCLVN